MLRLGLRPRARFTDNDYSQGYGLDTEITVRIRARATHVCVNTYCVNRGHIYDLPSLNEMQEGQLYFAFVFL